MRKWLKKLNDNVKIQVGFFVVSMVIIFFIFVIGIEWIDYDKAINGKIVVDKNVSRNIGEIILDGDRLVLSGWILRQNSINKDISIALRTIDSKKEYLISTTQNRDELVSNYFSEEFDYGEVAFTAKIDRNKLEKNVCYEIVFVLKYKDLNDEKDYKLNIATEKYIYNEKLYNYNPKEFIKPVFEDEFMNIVVTHGEMILYDESQTLYLYKHQDKMYWIAGEKFMFDDTERTYIVYQLGTSKIERLSSELQMFGFDNWDFYFEDNEYIFDNNSLYRVAVCGIPKNFPITYYYTAIYDLGKKTPKWEAYFYPTYVLY